MANEDLKDILKVVSEFWPYGAAVIAAAGTAVVAIWRQKQDGVTFRIRDLERQRHNLEEEQRRIQQARDAMTAWMSNQLEEAKMEREKARVEIMALRERLAVLEDNLREQEQGKVAAINRMRSELDKFRVENTRLIAENAELRSRLS